MFANSHNFSTYTQSLSQSGDAATTSPDFSKLPPKQNAFLISLLLSPISLPQAATISAAKVERISSCKTLSFIAQMRFFNVKYSLYPFAPRASPRKVSNTEATTPPCCLTCHATDAIVKRAPFQVPNELYFLRIFLASCLSDNDDHNTHKSSPLSVP